MSIQTLADSPLRWRQVPIVGLCLGGFVTACLLLVRDFQGLSVGVGGEAKVGVLEYKTGAVRRRSSSSFVWNTLGTGAPLHHKDSVQVGPESAARLQLGSGASLEVGENSLVTLDETGESPLRFVRGTFVVRKASGDSLVDVDEKGVPRLAPLQMRLATPQPEHTFYVVRGGRREIVFSWTASGGGKPGPVTIEVSTSRGFTPAQTRSAREINGEHRLLLDPGVYYWRVSPEGSRPTEVRRFKVVGVERPVALSPSEAALPAWKTTGRVSFTWEPVSVEGSRLALEVLRAGDSRPLTVDVSAQTGVAWVPDLESGSYKWRLRLEAGGEVIRSAPKSFRVISLEQLDLNLESPAPGAWFRPGETTELSWRLQAAVESVNYHWELKKDQRPLASRDTPQESISWHFSEAGTYSWRVTARTGGQQVGQSRWQTLVVKPLGGLTLRSPEPGQTFAYWTVPPSFAFEWSRAEEDEKVAGYALEWSQNAHFSPFKSISTDSTKIDGAKLRLEPGEWHWRVRAVTAEGVDVAVSEPTSFTLSPYGLLDPPTGLRPAEGGSFRKVSPSSEPELAWSEVKMAKGYEVRIWKGRVEGTPWRVAGSTQPSLQLKNVPPGDYYWTVSTRNPRGELGKRTDPRKLQVLPPPKLRAPKLKVR